MAVLPSGSSGKEAVGIEIVTVSDNAGIDKAESGLAEIDTAAAASNKSAMAASSSWSNLGGSLEKAGSSLSSIGHSMTMGITVPVLGIGAAATKLAMDFQQSMELLHTNAGIPQADIAALSTKVLDLAGSVGQNPNSLAQAFFHIATAGAGIFTTSQMLDQLKISAEGAAVGQANLDDTTYALTSTLAANVKGATDFNDTMGTLLGIVQAGDMHLSDLNEVIGTGLMGTLSTFGVSLQSAGAALADFGDLGEKGAAAGTRLRMMLALMTSPSAAASKILGDLGLTTGETATATNTMNDVFAKTGLTTTKLADDLRQPNGIYVAIMDLKTKLEQAGLSASQTDTVLAKAFGGGRTDAALLQLLNTTDRLDLKYQQIGQDSGNFTDNWNQQQQTIKQKWDDAWSGILSDMVKLGNALMPDVTIAINDIGKAIGGLTSWFEGLSGPQQQMLINFALAAAVIGPLLGVLGSFVGSLGNLVKLFGGAGGATLGWVAIIAIAAGAIYELWQKSENFRSVLKHIWDIIAPLVSVMISLVQFGFQMMMAAQCPI